MGPGRGVLWPGPGTGTRGYATEEDHDRTLDPSRTAVVCDVGGKFGRHCLNELQRRRPGRPEEELQNQRDTRSPSGKCTQVRQTPNPGSGTYRPSPPFPLS